MLRNSYFFSEILNVNQPQSAQKAGITGQVNKHSDRSTQSEVFSLSSTGKIRVPRSARFSLDLEFPYIAFQIWIPSQQLFSLEISVVDSSMVKRKLVFTHCRDIIKSELLARVPHSRWTKDTWNNLCIDINSFISHCWGTHSKCIDSVSLSGNCKVRRVFASKYAWENSNGPMSDSLTQDILPSNYEISVPHVNQFISRDTKNTEKTHIKNANYTTLPLESVRVKPKKRTIFHQEINVSPEPMFKSVMPGFFDKHFISLTKIRHHTPPLVNSDQGFIYDPVRRRYLK